MPEYLSPGTYVEEVRGDVVPIQGVGTSTAGFVGRTERGPAHATLVTSWPEYERWYGGIIDPTVSLLPISVQGYFANGGQRLYVARVVAKDAKLAKLQLDADGEKPTVQAIGPGQWGGRVFVRVSKATRAPDGFRLQVAYFRRAGNEPIDPTQQEADVFEDYDELSADPKSGRFAPGQVNPASNLVSISWEANKTPGKPKEAAFKKLGPDDAEPKLTAEDFKGSASLTAPTGLAALAAVDEVAVLAVPDAANAVLFPDLGNRQAIRSAIVEQCEKLRDRFAILDVERGATDITTNLKNYIGKRSNFAAIYYPHIRVFDPRNQAPVLVPPSGFVAGVYAHNDVTRGVHKAPANYELSGIVQQDIAPGEGPLEYSVSKGQHDKLNPLGVNVIRDFRSSGRGVRIWGARTISADPEWTYINVRRLFNYVEESIDKGLQWVVFEPNSEATWARLRRTVDTFLERVWRDGALMGDSKQQAYFVRCDSSTMTADDILNGRLICLIGMAPVRPAEFVVLRFSQKTIEAAS